MSFCDWFVGLELSEGSEAVGVLIALRGLLEKLVRHAAKQPGEHQARLSRNERRGAMKLTSRWVLAMVAMVLGLMVCGGAQAQEFRGTISGKVTDTTGAVIPGASITVKET